MSLVDYEVDGAVARVTLNRPPVNALNSALTADIASALTLAADPTVRAVVISGNRHFAAGADITRFVDAFDSDEELQASEVGAVALQLERLQKPVIAAISGYALGGGLELAMGADLRYLAEDAKVGQPEILLGIIPGAGGTQRLQRLIGYQAAKRLNMSGRHVGAAEAIDLGIGDLVVPADQLMDRAMEDAATWASGPTRAYAALKRAMATGYGRPLEEALAIERSEFNGCFRTADAKIGILAFIAKETPEFTGS